jgi:hypothetical protein
VSLLLKSVTGAGLAAAVSLALATETFPVPPELWDRPRSGRIVLDVPAVRQAVSVCLAQPTASLIIHHAAGQDPLLQAEELRAWLIALAMGAERISLRSDLTPGESLKLEVAQ